MDRNWLQQYPPGVPADIDPDSYASLRDIFEEACNARGHSPAFTNMGATLSYAQLDALSRAFAAWLQHKSGLSIVRVPDSRRRIGETGVGRAGDRRCAESIDGQLSRCSRFLP